MKHGKAKAPDPRGIILVAHEVLRTISQEEMIGALPVRYQHLPRVAISIDAGDVRHSDLGSLDWSAARQQQEIQFRSKLELTIRSNPGWRLQYFGFAPIPLAMHLGYLVGGMTPVDVYQQRHDTNTWAWATEGRSRNLRFKRIDLAKDKLSAEGDLVIRVSISHRVDRSDTAATIPHHLGEFDLELVTPHEDALSSLEDLEAVKQRFDALIDWAHAHRPNARINVFAAVTVGVAFRLGAAINPTIHSLVQTYQFAKNSTPRYTSALVLQMATQQPIGISSEQSLEAAEFRDAIAAELREIQKYAVTLHDRDAKTPARSWLDNILRDVDQSGFYGPIANLKKIFDTPIVESSIDLEITSLPDGFRFDTATRSWQLDDRLLLAISRRLKEPAAKLQAARLLLLHEGVHLASHALTEATASQIRRFPKILEEIDYQADVWGVLHDYALQRYRDINQNIAVEAYFRRVIETALETFWAFDDASEPDRIEIRRLNRYLIWYWQQLGIERCRDLSDVLAVLAMRPSIEIAGPSVFTRENRIFYSLDPTKFDEPELGILFKQRIARYGHGPGSRAKDVLVGFRERDSEKIRFALRTVFDQLATG